MLFLGQNDDDSASRDTLSYKQNNKLEENMMKNEL